MRLIFAAAVALSAFAAPVYAADPVATDPAAAAVAHPNDPANIQEKPEGATALCKDGTWTKTHNHTGACASHKGVVRWIQDI
jgi:hypothetical protein